MVFNSLKKYLKKVDADGPWENIISKIKFIVLRLIVKADASCTSMGNLAENPSNN